MVRDEFKLTKKYEWLQNVCVYKIWVCMIRCNLGAYDMGSNFHKLCVFIHVWQCKLGIYQMAGGEDGRG